MADQTPDPGASDPPDPGASDPLAVAASRETLDTREIERSDSVGTSVNIDEAHKKGTVFWTAVGISAVFVLAGVLLTEPFNEGLAAIVGVIKDGLGWFYLLAATFFLIFVLYIAFSKYGKLTLGAPGDKPEFGLFSWFAMLFQAGMGIGILFWGVGEPILHYNHPPLGQAEAATPEAANLSLQYAFFHWGLHPWAMYATVGLAVGYFSYRRGLNNLRISTVFRPVFGDRVDGGLGKAIDIVSIMATLFGVAVSLGLGTLQIDAGLNQTFGTPSGTGMQMGIIAVTAVAYMLSASTPIEKGVQTLSNVSMILAFVLLVYFFVVGVPLLALNAMTQEVGLYGINLLPMSLRTNAFDPDPWLGDWTIFFWATWIAWAPYVGAFIARISRGRTIRQFVVGVLAAPTLFTVVWFSVFGAAGINEDRKGQGALGDAVSEDAAVAFFEFIDLFPLAGVISVLVIFLIWIFFVAGADAGTVVLGSMSTGGVLNPKRVTKLTWGVIMGAIAAILLAAGGLDALQNGAILAATPFAVLMLIMCYSLLKAMKEDADQAPELQADYVLPSTVARRAPGGRPAPVGGGAVSASEPRMAAGGSPDQPAAGERRQDG